MNSLSWRGPHDVLTAELLKAGFIVVDLPDTADAILTGSKGMTMVVDAPQPDPPEHNYIVELRRATSVVWQTHFTISSKSSDAEVDAQAARRIAERRLKAWENSAKRAGVIGKNGGR